MQPHRRHQRHQAPKLTNHPNVSGDVANTRGEIRRRTHKSRKADTTKTTRAPSPGSIATISTTREVHLLCRKAARQLCTNDICGCSTSQMSHCGSRCRDRKDASGSPKQTRRRRTKSRRGSSQRLRAVGITAGERTRREGFGKPSDAWKRRTRAKRAGSGGAVRAAAGDVIPIDVYL